MAEALDLRIAEDHPLEAWIRRERFPHIWCPGCGLGSALAAFVRALRRSSTPRDLHVCVSGIGCAGRIAGYLAIDSYHTTHGRAIPFAVGMKLARPELEVTVFSGDGDLFTIGGNHFLHAARRNVDLNVFCVNNFVYGMTGGQFGATTPSGAHCTTAPYGNAEAPLNLPYLAAALGAPFVARWTTLHVHELSRAMARAMEVPGFAFIEIISPCPEEFGKRNGFQSGLSFLEFLENHCVVDHEADLREVGIDLLRGKPIVLGNFVDRAERPSFEALQQEIQAVARAGAR